MVGWFKTAEPVGEAPTGRVFKRQRTCIHCAKYLTLKRWDDWNGFLVACPHCKRLHGRPWNRKAILWGSFFFSALSFFFTMRPAKAFGAIIVFVAIGFLGNYFFDRGYLQQIIETGLTVVFIFTPMLINGALILRHQALLDHPDPTKTKLLALFQEAGEFLLS